MSEKIEIAVFGGGCFWCTEAVFGELGGVFSVMPGYAGGGTKNPMCAQVCSGTTGHAEVIKIEFNPGKISYDDLLAVFFAAHDPTTKNRQGGDVGTQYRSLILYADDSQRQKAESFIEKLNASGKPVVTELMSLEKFYPAEKCHRQYFRNNASQSYCQLVINPKLEMVKEKFYKLIKKI